MRGCLFRPRRPLHPLRPRQDGVYRGGGWGAPSQPTCRPARDPRPQTSDWHLDKSRERLICCCLLREPRLAGAADAPGPAPRPGSLIKTQRRGRDRDPPGEGTGRFLETLGWATRSLPRRKARRPTGQGGRAGGDSGPGVPSGWPGGRGGGRAAGAARGGGPGRRSARHLRRRLPRPRPLALSPPANFAAGPLCSRLLWRLFAWPGDPTSPTQPARRPASPGPRASRCPAGGSVPRPRGARRDGRAEGDAGGRRGGGGWPVPGDGRGARGGLFTCRGTSPCRYRTRS